MSKKESKPKTEQKGLTDQELVKKYGDFKINEKEIIKKVKQPTKKK